jgi:predicted nucleic acid-binding protein
VRFWDSSAIVPVIFDEPVSPQVRALAEDGARIAVWWATVVECASAIARRERRGELGAREVGDAIALLDGLADRWIEVPPIDRVRDVARRIVTVHDVRAADALQLAAARAASDEHPAQLPFVTLDERLATAARREGFRVLPAS